MGPAPSYAVVRLKVKGEGGASSAPEGLDCAACNDSTSRTASVIAAGNRTDPGMLMLNRQLKVRGGL